MNLIEEIKALPSWVFEDIEYVDIDDVLKILQPVLAHLQNFPTQFGKCEGMCEDCKTALWDWKEELDKLMGKSE